MKVALPRNPVPMFPLPGVFLFPSQILPLHVFEERYRQLVEDCLDGPGRILVPTVVGAGEPPPVLPVAGLGDPAIGPQGKAIPAGGRQGRGHGRALDEVHVGAQIVVESIPAPFTEFLDAQGLGVGSRAQVSAIGGLLPNSTTSPRAES